MPKATVLLITIFVASLIPVVAQSEIPHQISFQGKLDSSGVEVPDGNYQVIFKIYDDSVAGNMLWNEAQTVEAQNGLFSTMLGKIIPLPDSVFLSANRFLGIQIGSHPEMPHRFPISSAAYSFHSLTTDSGGPVADSDWTISGENIYRLNGNVGIGTDNPGDKLDVAGTAKFRYVATVVDNSVFAPQLTLNNHLSGGRQYSVSSGEISSRPGDFVIVDETAGGLPRMSIDPSGNVGIATGSFPASLIVNGNVGIGTSNPTQKIQVNSGNLQFHSGDNPYSLIGGIRFGTSYNNWDDWSGIEGWCEGGLDQADLRFYTSYNNRSERMRITPYGNVCIGTANSVYKFDVNGDIHSAANLYVDGNLCVIGQKNAIVPTSNGMTKVYSEESAECWFTDYGEAHLKDGKAHIDIDPLFLETVTIDSHNPMQVYLQEYDESNGLMVKRGMNGFDVIEKGGGQSNASFSYRIVAKRKGQENARLQTAGMTSK